MLNISLLSNMINTDKYNPQGKVLTGPQFISVWKVLTPKLLRPAVPGSRDPVFSSFSASPAPTTILGTEQCVQWVCTEWRDGSLQPGFILLFPSLASWGNRFENYGTLSPLTGKKRCCLKPFPQVPVFLVGTVNLISGMFCSLLTQDEQTLLQ